MGEGREGGIGYLCNARPKRSDPQLEAEQTRQPPLTRAIDIKVVGTQMMIK